MAEQYQWGPDYVIRLTMTQIRLYTKPLQEAASRATGLDKRRASERGAKIKAARLKQTEDLVQTIKNRIARWPA